MCRPRPTYSSSDFYSRPYKRGHKNEASKFSLQTSHNSLALGYLLGTNIQNYPTVLMEKLKYHTSQVNIQAKEITTETPRPN